MSQMIEVERSSIIGCRELGLHADYANILSGVTLDIPRGAVVGLVGRNGAGKSTLLRCMVGLAAPSSGVSTLLGCPSLDLTDAVRGRLGYVAQTPDLFEWMTGYEHIETLGRAYPSWNQERCMLLALRLALPLGRPVRKMSGGDQQKLAVVLALAHDPEVLVLDEPVSSLDPMTRRDFMRSMFSGHAENDDAEPSRVAPTIIISSHLLNDLERVVSHIAFLRDGRLQLFDTWDAMLEHLRLVPSGAVDIPAAAIVCSNRSHNIIDTRLAPALHDTGRVMSLDELFVELNS
ncbi:putative ABC transporter ATP-binding protein [Collimonas arenae]|uniref:Putative ABC transporter ATP-binding protein n=1 Tax=Collimonas arenae TaxID=279058 RepID=A0A0A1F605_9BURK|nr:ABC transporter ATP-binding protein [Collimonas arenae]AIY39966.1 putative ABC transporter ATP-binding protein [Collimonas arenae]